MSRLRYNAISSSWSGPSPRTYFVDPPNAFSSDPQRANRTALVIRGCEPSAAAVSSTAANPDPSSLIPGLRAELSRWAPTITTFLVSPDLVCASTFRAFFMTGLLSSTSFTGALVRRSAALASLPMTPTGTVSFW